MTTANKPKLLILKHVAALARVGALEDAAKLVNKRMADIIERAGGQDTPSLDAKKYAEHFISQVRST